MSIAPAVKKDDVFKPKLASRISHSAAKTTERFFANPSYYLFYAILIGITAYLFTGNHVAWELYIFLMATGIISLQSKKKGDDKS